MIGRLAFASVLAMSVAPHQAAAASPAIVRVRVPSARVDSWFPGGAELVAIPFAEFETLARSVEAGVPDAPESRARIVRATHRVSWKAGQLIGRTTFDVHRNPARPESVPLAPWNLAIDSAEGADFQVRTTAAGTPSLWLPSKGSDEVVVGWKSVPGPSSSGRSFSLRLPRVEIAVLELDLPDDLVPEGFAADPTGHGGAGGGVKRWRLGNASGAVEIRIVPGSQVGGSERDWPWVSGPTTVDLGPSSATWRAEWVVEPNPVLRPIRVELSPGVEPVEVVGPGVASFQTGRLAGCAVVTVRFRPDVRGPTTITIRGIAPIRDGGGWTVPAARPLDAVWTGGNTTVLVDATLGVTSARVLQGRRIPPRPGEPTGRTILAFEPVTPGPVAVLTLAGGPSLQTLEVRGVLRANREATTLLAQLKWSSPRGRPGEIAFDLPEAWSLDRAGPGVEALPWHREAIGDGWDRIRLATPPVDEGLGTVSLRIQATRTSLAPGVPFDLPRIRAVGMPAADELWIATADAGRVVSPSSAAGVAWIDPSIVPSASFRPPFEPAELARALAWRWIDAGARATATVSATPRGELASDVEGTATIRRDRLHFEWSIAIGAGSEAPRMVPVYLSEGPDGGFDWQLRSGTGPGLALSCRPLTVAERAEAGFPADRGTAIAVGLPEGLVHPVHLVGTLDRPWPGAGRIPLAHLPDAFHARARLAVRVAKDLLTRSESNGVRELDDVEADGATVDPARVGPSSSLRVDHRFGYRGVDSWLRLETTTSTTKPPDLVIASSRLDTTWRPDGPSRHRLRMEVLASGPRSLAVRMPLGHRLERALVDGRPVTVFSDPSGLRIPFGEHSGRRVGISLDYSEEATAGGSGPIPLRPPLPATEADCIRFTWHIRIPGGWQVGGVGPGLTGLDPGAGVGPERLLIRGSPVWPTARTAAVGPRSTIETLRGRLPSLKLAPDLSIAACLLELDGSPLPLVVDRVGLDAAGLGPDTPIGATSAASGPTDPGRVEIGGIALMPLGRAVLVTTPRSADVEGFSRASSREAWDVSAIEAIQKGSVAEHRLVSVPRWCEEAGLTPGVPGARPSADSPGADTWLECNGWPAADAWILPEPAGRRYHAGHLLALALLGLGLGARRLPSRWRGLVPGLVSAAALIAAGLGPSVPAWIRLGLGLGALSTWLARPPRPVRPATDLSRASRIGTGLGARRPGSTAAAAGTLSLVAMLGVVPGSVAGDRAGSEPPILVLLPYDGPPDPSARPLRALLQLADYERLRAISRAINPTRGSSLTALDAVHTAEFADAAILRLATEFTLVLEGQDPVDWSVPVEEAMEIRASVDDRPVPCRIVDEGKTARIRVAGEGRHRLRVDRSVKLAGGRGAGRVTWAINPVPHARLTLVGLDHARDYELEGRTLRIESTRGRCEVDLGPAVSVGLISRGDGDDHLAPEKGAYDALALWDARPAGDFLRLRLTSRRSDRVGQLRLTVDPDAIVRPLDGRRVVEVAWRRSPDGAEWVGTFDPPFRRGEAIALEVWRPRPPGIVANAGAVRRGSPRFRAGGESSISGVLAFRRPGDWSGRLSGQTGFDALDEESFVNAWGPLPDEPYTLAGVRGFQAEGRAEVESGPVRPRRSVTPSVRLELGEGRVDVQVEAELTDLAGLSTELDVSIPASLVLERATADGLAGFDRPEPGRVHLEFQPLDAPARRIVLRGHLPVASDSVSDETRAFRQKTPWPSWSDAVEEPGTLTLVALTPPQVEHGRGLTSLTAGDPIAASTQVPVFRKVYRVEHPDDAGAVAWRAAAPRVAVFLNSRLGIGENSAELNATIRYEVAGGPLGSLYLKVPSAWAEGAQVEVAGDNVQMIAETRGEWTLWTLRPRKPIWGSARLVVRLSREGLGRQPLAFPDIIPLGQGVVEKRLTVERRTTLPIEVEASPGLIAVDPAQIQDATTVGGPLPAVRAFRVAGDQWSLHVRVGVPPRRGIDLPGRAGVRKMDTGCVVARDGGAWGRASLFVDARRGSSFSFGLRPDSAVVWASADGRPARILSSGPGRWSIPFESTGPVEVDLVWKSASGTGEGARPLDLPALDEPDVPTLISVAAAPGLILRGGVKGLEPIDDPAARAWRVERLARRIVDVIGEIDRSSAAQERDLLALLRDYHLEDRMARAAGKLATRPPESSGPRGVPDGYEARLDKTRSVLVESLEVNGLDDLVPLVAPATGDGAGPARWKDVSFARPTPRPFMFGREVHYRSTLGGAGLDNALVLERERREPSSFPGFWAGVASGLAALAAGLWRGGSQGRKSVAHRAALVLGLAATLLVAPMAGVILTIASLIGRHA